MKVKALLKSIIVSILSTIVACPVKGQDVSSIYDVDLSTGIANISIPIISNQFRDNEFGVSISYNTKGVPVRELAGIVGSHWNLNVGGSISRIVKGLPDEWYSQAFQDSILDGPGIFISTYDRYRGRLIEGMETPTEKLNPKTYRDPESDEYVFSVGKISFNFYLGRNGTIYVNDKRSYDISILKSDGTPYNMPPLPPRISQLGNPVNTPLVDFTFKVKDPQSGLTYFFSKSTSAIINVTAFFRSPYSRALQEDCGLDVLGIHGDKTPVTVSWKLDSVITANNEKIEYIYERFIFPPYLGLDTNAYRILHTYVNSGFPAKDDTIKSSSLNPMLKATDTVDLVKEIRFPYKGAKVIFNYEKNSPRLEFWSKTSSGTVNSSNGYYFFSKLNSIQFVELGSTKTFKFQYSYFHTPHSSYPQVETSAHFGDADDMYSLKLKKITLYNSHTGTDELLFSFAYNDNKARRFAKGLDYHGFFRGGTKNTDSGTAHYSTIAGHSIYGLENREPDSVYMQWGILTSITSGSGGKLTFQYGIHKLLALDGTHTTGSNWVAPTLITPFDPNQFSYVIGDGLKVISVIIEDRHDPRSKRTIKYTYGDGVYFLPGGVYAQPTVFLNKEGNDIKGMNVNEQFLNPAYFYRGTNHCYGWAQEQHLGWQNQQIIRKEYSLTSCSNGNSRFLVVGGGQQSVNFPFTRKQYLKHWEIGLPLSIVTFDDKDFIVEEQSFEYEYYLDTLSSFVAQVTDTNRVVSNIVGATTLYEFDDVFTCPNVMDFKVTKDPYRPYKGMALLKKSTTKKFIADGIFTSETKFVDYDSRQNQKSVRSRNSKNEYIEKYIVYNYDLDPGGHPALNLMHSEGTEYVVATEVWNNGTANGNTRNANSKLLEANILVYEHINNGIESKKTIQSAMDAPMPYSSYMSGAINGVAAPILSSYNAGNPGANFEVLTEVKQWDVKGNPVETYLPQTNMYKSMIWDWHSGNKVADVANAKYSDIAYAGFEISNEHNIHLGVGSHVLFINDNGVMTLPPNFNVNVPVSTVLLGNHFCLIAPSSSSNKSIYVQSLQPNAKYRATFWCSGNAVPQFGIEGGAQFTLTHIATKGQYKQYEVIFTPTAPNQKIGLNCPSVSVAIDELRIHPFDAEMTTYTYKGLVGKVSETDALGRIMFYEYDALGRLKLIRDQEGNILEKRTYGVQTMD